MEVNCVVTLAEGFVFYDCNLLKIDLFIQVSYKVSVEALAHENGTCKIITRCSLNSRDHAVDTLCRGTWKLAHLRSKEPNYQT